MPSSAEPFPDKNVFLAVLVSMFLHGSWLHLRGNMLFLWIFGNNIEDRLGQVGYAFFYLVAGVAAALAHIATQPSSIVPVVGASGAIAGVMGAYLVLFPKARILTIIPLFIFLQFVYLPAYVVLLGWFVLQFFTNPNTGVAAAAHIGGFVFGAAIGLFLRGTGQPAEPCRPAAPAARLGFRRPRATSRPALIGQRVDHLVGQGGQARADERRVVVGGLVAVQGGRRHDQGEGPAEGRGQRPVGGRAVAGDDPPLAEPAPDQGHGRRLRLARHLRPATGGGGHRGHQRPVAGQEPVRSRVGGVELVATNRAPARMAADARSSRSKSNVRCQPTTTASAGPASTTSKPRASRASTTPGPLQARTFDPGARSAARRSAAARALVRTSAGSASTPKRASFSHVPGHRQAGVVGHEADGQPGSPEPGHRLGRAGQGLVTEPQHPVEIQDDGRQAAKPKPAAGRPGTPRPRGA